MFSNVAKARTLCSYFGDGEVETMAATELAEQTYFPAATAEDELAQVRSFLEAHERIRGAEVEPRFLLVGDGEGDQVELPEEIYRALLQVVVALSAGRAVSVAPRSKVMTTQQAADLLGVSRPTVVRLIDSGELPAQRPGTRRQVLLSDVLDYRRKRRKAQYAMLAATSVDLDEEDDPSEVAAQLRAVRKAVAARRRG
jgi:excisionase family DNA binding protein